MPTIIAIHPSGFEVRFEVELEEIRDMVRKLEQRHYRPSRELTYTAEGLPICPRHGVPMQKREKQGDVWYSHKVIDPATGEVLYCRGYDSPSSPGFVVEPADKPPSLPPANSQVREPVAAGNGFSVDALNEELFG